MTNLAVQKKWIMSKLLPPSLAIFFILLFSIPLFAQQGAEILVEANETHTVNMFFPDIITKALVGSDNFQFSFDPNTQIGSLQSRKGKDSNMTVVTKDGNIYSFLLKYEDKISTYNIFIDKENSIGAMKGRRKVQMTSNDVAAPEPIQNQATSDAKLPSQSNNMKVASKATTAETVEPTPLPQVTPEITSSADNTEPMESAVFEDPDIDFIPSSNETIATDSTEEVLPEDMFLPPPSEEGGFTDDQNDLYFTDREEYFRIFCENNFMQPSYIKRTFTTSKGVILRLNNILGDRNELYFILQIENGSKGAYKTNFLNFFKQKKSPKDQILLEPLYKYNLQELIEPQGINEVVYVFKKFKILPKEKVVAVLDEKEGRRTLVLSIFDKQINSIKL